MKRNIDITRAKEEFEWVFMRRVLGPYSAHDRTKKDIINDVKERMRKMTAAYHALTDLIENDKLDFLNQ